MKKIYYISFYLFLISIVYFNVSKWFSFQEDKKDLIEYKVIDVVKEINSVYLLVELNNHYYIVHKSLDNVIFRHYKDCPFCRKKFVPFIFSIHDGYNSKLQEKYKKISKGE